MLAIMDTHKWIMDIHNWIMDIHNWIMDIHIYALLAIHSFAPRYHIYTATCHGL